MDKIQAKKASPSQVFKDENGVVSPLIDQDHLREMVRDIVEEKKFRH